MKDMPTPRSNDESLHVTPIAAPVRAQVVANLRSAILSGRFAPGERLIEALLCEMLQVSRTSLREALRQLEAERLITIKPFKGPAVAIMTVDDAKQIYEARALLEGHAAKLFADRATQHDVENMQQALEKFEAADKAGNALERIACTDEFYDVILRGCGNRMIMELLEGLHARVNFLRYRSMSSPSRANESAKEMRAMLTAIKAKSPAEAAQAARSHIRHARAAALKILEKQESPSEGVSGGVHPYRGGILEPAPKRLRKG
ncbi:GntR family transcriptional regulator [Methylovirgula ligni]|nr:GntR family transcriptional regulator [Methylovirgula ligni]